MAAGASSGSRQRGRGKVEVEGVKAVLHFLPIAERLGPPDLWRTYVASAFKAAGEQVEKQGEVTPLVHFHLPFRNGAEGSWVALLDIAPLCRLGLSVASRAVRQVVRDTKSDGFFVLAEGWQEDAKASEKKRSGMTALERNEVHPSRPPEALIGTLETPVYRIMFVARILKGKAGRRIGKVQELREPWFEMPFSVWNIPSA